MCGFESSRFNIGVRKKIAHLANDTKFLDVRFRGSPREFPDFKVTDSTGEYLEFSPYFAKDRASSSAQVKEMGMTSADLRAVWASLDRVYVKQLSTLEKERIWEGWTRGCSAVLESIKPLPTVAIFTDTPHFHWDIALSMALQQKGVRVVCLYPSVTDGLLLIGELQGSQLTKFATFENPVEKLAPTRSGDNNELAHARLRRSRGINADFSREQLAKSNEANLVKRALWAVRTGVRLLQATMAPPGYLPYGRWARLSLALRWLRQKRKFLVFFEQFGLRTIPEGEFAYFALHNQPERSTTPEGGDYWSQIGAIRRLRDALPQSIPLVVGEHPRQLLQKTPEFRQLLFRSVDFYEHVQAMPGVTLAHWSVNGSDLIKEASLVGTCTGSSAWEAMQLGIPSVVFGLTMYSVSPSCLVGANSKNLHHHVKILLQRKSEEVLRDNDSVFSFTELCGVPGFTLPSQFEQFTDEELSTISLATAERLMEITSVNSGSSGG